MRDDEVVGKAGDGLARVFPVDLGDTARASTPRTASKNIAIRVGVVCASLCVVASDKRLLLMETLNFKFSAW